MRSLTVVRKGADVVVIYVMEIDVNIVWPMDFVRWIILSIFEDTIEAFQVPLSTQTTWNSSCLPSHSMTIRKRTLNNNGININFFITFFSKQVLFLTNSSAPPDSQIKKAKIRDYNISISYLRRVIFTIHKTFFDAF